MAESVTSNVSTNSNPPDPSSEDRIKNTGRGFLVITAAKVWFLITGAIIQLGLPIFLGSAEQFGVFKVVTEAMSLLNMVMITGTLQAVSKLVSEQPSQAVRAVGHALKLQLLLGLPIAAAYAIFAPYISAAFNDPSLTPLIRLSSLIVFFYAFYAIFVGYFNGLKEFVKQATLDITFATLKTAGILLLVFLGFGVAGAVSGFVAAAGIICVTSAIWTFRVMRARKLPADKNQTEVAQTTDNIDESGRAKRLFRYLILFMIYTVALNAVMRADLFVLKSTASSIPDNLLALPDASQITDVFTTISNKFAGFYGAVLNLARIPYQGIIAVTFVIFPMISEATFRDDLTATRTYISTTLRYCTILTVSVAILLATNADSIIGVLYSSDYQAASTALATLSISIIFFALLYVAMTVMMSAGHAVAAVVIMFVTLVISATLNILFIQNVHSDVITGLSKMIATLPNIKNAQSENALDSIRYAVNVASFQVDIAGPYLKEAPRYMAAASKATLVAMFAGCGISLGYIYYVYRATIPGWTLLRTIVASVAVWGLDTVAEIPTAWLHDFSRVELLGVVIAKMVALALVFFAILLITREFNRTDLNRIRKVIGK